MFEVGKVSLFSHGINPVQKLFRLTTCPSFPPETILEQRSHVIWFAQKDPGRILNGGRGELLKKIEVDLVKFMCECEKNV
jgi:hypothetical protein